MQAGKIPSCENLAFMRDGNGMLITYVSVKGGSGKTSLSVAHAGWAFDNGYGSIGFLDADYQKLGSLWLKKAEPKIDVRQATSPAEVEKHLKALLAKHDLVIADGPGGLDKQNVVLIKHADLCVIPVMASPLDVHSAYAGAKQLVAAISKRHRRKRTVRFVINGLDNRTGVSKNIRGFAKRMDPPAAKHTVRRLTDIVKASDLSNPTIPTRMPHATNARTDLGGLYSELMELTPTQKRAGND